MDNISNKTIREKVYNKYGGKCAYCGCDLKHKFTIDHIIPKRRWNTKLPHGTDTLENYVPCCHSCNSSKNSYELEEFRQNIQGKLNSLNKYSSVYRIAKRFGMVVEVNNPIVFYFEKEN